MPQDPLQRCKVTLLKVGRWVYVPCSETLLEPLVLQTSNSPSVIGCDSLPDQHAAIGLLLHN